MTVRRLALTAFRSYPGLELHLGPGPHVVAGPNAAGKTNLLEALVVLSRGRSHRTSVDAELVAWGQPFARLEAEVERGASSATLEVVLVRPGEATRKRIRVDGIPRRPGALAAALRTVVFAPEDMLLVTGSPGLRRESLDALVVQRVVAAASSLSSYGRALAQRNALLRRIREGEASRDELPYWDRVLVEEGGRVMAWRLGSLAALADPLREAHHAIAPHEGELTLRYQASAPMADGEEPASALARRLAETREKELWNGATLVGPHRDDVAFVLDGRELAGFASRGQQRSAILALKLAELEVLSSLDGRPPLLLLDDVFSELDPERRGHLVRAIAGLPQALITTTSTEDLDPALLAMASAWHVEPGAIVRGAAR